MKEIWKKCVLEANGCSENDSNYVSFLFALVTAIIHPSPPPPPLPTRTCWSVTHGGSSAVSAARRTLHLGREEGLRAYYLLSSKWPRVPDFVVPSVVKQTQLIKREGQKKWH